MKKLMSLPSTITRSIFTRVTAFKRIRLILGTVVVVTLLASVIFVVFAASPSIWNGGGGDDLWTTAANWNNNVPVPSTTYDLQFAGSTRLTPNNDFTAASNFRNITFNSGAGAFTLSGNSITLNGNVTNSSSNLQTFTLNLNTTAVRTFTGASGFTIGLNGDTTKGVISGTGGGVTLATSGNVVTLWGNNTYTGNTTVASGTTLNINSATAIGTGTLVFSGNGSMDNTSGGSITLANNNPVTLSGGSSTFTGTNSLNLGTGAFTISGSNRSVTVSGGALTIGGVVSQDATPRVLQKLGTGTLTLSGANVGGSAFTGGMRLSAGTLNINNANALGTGTFNIDAGTPTIDNTSGGAITVATNNAITLGSNTTFTGTNALHLGNGAVTLSGANRTLTVSGSTLTIGGAIGQDVAGRALTKAGAGTLVLSGTNNYTGNTTIGAGTLSVGSIGDSGANGNVGAGTTINFGSTTTNGTLLYTGSGETSTKIINLNGTTGGGTIDQSGTGLLKFTGTNTATGAGIKDLTLQGSTAGTGEISGAIVNNSGANTTSVVKAGTGSWTLSGNNTYTGSTTINQGTLTAGSTTAIGPAANARLIFGGTLAGKFQLNGNNITVVELNNLNIATGSIIESGSGTAGTDTLTVNNTSIGAFEGVIQNGSTRALALTVGGTGTLFLGGVNTYTGPTTINATGTLALKSNGSIATTPSITMAGGATFDTTSLAGTYTFGNSQTIIGTGTTSSAQFSSANGISMGTTTALTMTYAVNNPTFNVSSFPFTLQSGNPVTVSTTSVLPAGNYVLISKSGSGTVVGTAPTSLTITGSGIAPGTTASLAIIGQQLVLQVVAPPDMTFNASGNLPAGNYNNVTINNCGTFVTMTGNVTIYGTLTINACAHLLTDTFIVSGPGSFVLNSDGWLHIGSPNGITTSPTLSGNIQVTGGRSYSTAGNYVYTGVVNQAVGNGLPGTVANLLISNTGPGGNNTVTGNPGQIVTVLLEMVAGVYSSASDYVDVQIDVGGTLSLAANITVSGNWTNNGTFNSNGFTVTFDGTGAQLITTGGNGAGQDFDGVIINKASGTATLAGDLLSTSLSITSGGFDQGATFGVDTGATTVGASGVWTNTGTGDFDHSGAVTNSGSITFNGNGAACGQADDILIASGSQQPWSGLGTFSMTDVTVLNQGGTAPIIVRSGTNLSGNGPNWVFIAACTGGDYTWTGTVNTDWAVAGNWSPARVTPDPGDFLYFTLSTPAPTVTNVAGALGETIGLLQIQFGVAPTFSASGPRTLTINAGAGNLGFDVDSLAITGANPLRIELDTGTTGLIYGVMTVSDGGHRLISNTPNAITFDFLSLFTTSTGFTGNAFGTGGPGDGAPGSVHFALFSTYTHNAGSSPFGASGNPSVVVFEAGSEARFFTATGFDASDRKYSILTIGSVDPGGTEVDASQSGTGDFEFDELNVRSPNSGVSSLTYNGSGASTIRINGSIFSDGNVADTTTNDTTLVAGTGGIILNSGSTQELCGTSDRPATFGSNALVTNDTEFLLERNLIVSPGTSVLTIDPGSTLTAGTPSPGGYVIGKLRKTVSAGTNTFEVGTANGYSPVTLNVTFLVQSPTFTASATNSYMTGITDTTRAIQRFWTLETDAPANNLIGNLTFQYVPTAPPTGDESVNVDRNTLNVFRRNGDGSINELPATSRITTDPPSVTVNGVNAFSDWTLANGNSQVTYAKLRSFDAISTARGNVVRWQTSYEVDNLGFNLYRMEAKQMVRVTPSLVAGSALVAGPKTAMTAGMSYSWRDPKGQPGSEYYLEDVDLGGTRTMNGPIVPVAAENTNLSYENQARLLSELNEVQAPSADAVTGRPAAMSVASITPARTAPAGKNGADQRTVQNDPILQQRALASGQAVKIAIRQTGWYRVTREELTAAGLNANVDTRTLQLYADGAEQAILVNDGSIEFYGTGMDTATSSSRTYWLVAGAQAGKRIQGSPQGSNSSGQSQKGESNDMMEEVPLQSYAYTVERKDRTLYFAALLNGEAENFFGAIVTTAPTRQTLNLTGIDQTASGPGLLEVALQGATLKPHKVRVSINGTEVGTVEYSGREHAVKQIQVPRPSLIEGNNTITFEALGTDSDVSLVDYARMTYYRTYQAANDSIVFTSDHTKTMMVEGFTSPQIRVFDITDANNVTQMGSKVMTKGSSYAVKVAGGKGTTRTLLAITDAQMMHPAAIGANETSDLTNTDNRADFVILTHRDFRSAVEPLAQLRRNQGMEVAVVNVEDVYDEFSYGAPSRQAIRDFFSYAVTKWAKGPGYALLVGDASYDPRNYLKTTHQDFVPTKLVDTGLLETASDDALVDFNNDSIADISIGRLPAQTLEQAQKMVGKITGYVPGQSGVGVLLVADHYEGYDFVMANERLRALLPPGTPVAAVNRGERATEQVRGEIIAGINQGPMIVNYAGHGSVEVWTGSGILRSLDAPALTNGQKAPLFVTMTCLNGFFQDVSTESLAEALMKADNGGAVAVWASSGLTEPEGQSLMDQQLMRLLFADGQAPLLGDAVRGAKAATTDADVRRTWILFGDPTMRMR